MANARADLGSLLVEMGNTKEVEPLISEVLIILDKHGSDDWKRFNVERLLAGIRTAQKRYSEAEPLLRSGYEGLMSSAAKIPFQKPSPIASALTRLIEFAEAKGDPAQAARWKKALTEFNQTATPPTTAPPVKGQ